MRKTVKSEVLLKILHGVTGSAYVADNNGETVAALICQRILAELARALELTDEEFKAACIEGFTIADQASAMIEKEEGVTVQ